MRCQCFHKGQGDVPLVHSNAVKRIGGTSLRRIDSGSGIFTGLSEDYQRTVIKLSRLLLSDQVSDIRFYLVTRYDAPICLTQNTMCVKITIHIGVNTSLPDRQSSPYEHNRTGMSRIWRDGYDRAACSRRRGEKIYVRIDFPWIIAGTMLMSMTMPMIMAIGIMNFIWPEIGRKDRR